MTPWNVAHQAPLSLRILQAKILEWVATPSSRGTFQPRDWTQVFRVAGRFFTIWVTREANPGCRQCKCRTRLGSSLGISEWILLWTVMAANSLHLCFPLGSPGGSMVKKKWPWSLVGKIPWRRKLQSTSVFLPGKSHGQNSLAGYSPWGRWELDMTEHTYMHVLPFRQHRNINPDHPLLPPTDLVRTITKKQLQSTL